MHQKFDNIRKNTALHEATWLSCFWLLEIISSKSTENSGFLELFVALEVCENITKTPLDMLLINQISSLFDGQGLGLPGAVVFLCHLCELLFSGFFCGSSSGKAKKIGGGKPALTGLLQVSENVTPPQKAKVKWILMYWLSSLVVQIQLCKTTANWWCCNQAKTRSPSWSRGTWSYNDSTSH